MHKLTSNIIDLFKKDKQTVEAYNIFHKGIAQFERLVKDEQLDQQIRIELEMIANTHIPKILNSFLSLTPEQKTSSEKIRDNKNNYELLKHQLLLIADKINELYDLSIERKQINFLAMHRKTQQVHYANVETETMKESSVVPVEEFSQEAISLFSKFDGTWENGFKKPTEQAIAEKGGLNPKTFMLMFGGIILLLILGMMF